MKTLKYAQQQRKSKHKRLIPAKGEGALADLYRKITETKQRALQMVELQRQANNGPRVTADVADRFPVMRHR